MLTKTIMEKVNPYYLAIVVLTILPIILGGVMIRDLVHNKPSDSNPALSPTRSVAQANTWKVTDDVLNAPPENAPQNQIDAYVKLVLKNAQETNTLTLKDCTPDPLVVKVPKSGKVTVENPDDHDHLIVFRPEQTATIPKKARTEISIPFPEGIQIIGYGCDGAPNGVGRFVAP